MEFKITSSKPKKQRAFYHGMPLHSAQNVMAVHLARGLRKETGRRAIGVRKGDTVKVMRGDNKGKEGKITSVDYKKKQVFVDGVVRKKSSGAEVPVPLQHSNLLLLEMERKDERRLGKKKAKEVKSEKNAGKAVKEKSKKKEGK